MKKILLLLGVMVCIAATQIVFAQTEGVIIYEVRINLHRLVPKDREEMKTMMPEYKTDQDQLIFNATESLYKIVEEEDDDFNMDSSPRHIRMHRPNNEIYINHGSSKRVLLQEFMGKRYLIEDSVKLSPWKLGTETKEVNGYMCKRASYFNEEQKQTIVAWYTDRLRPFLGPENFNNLPGAVLEINIDEGTRIITAKTIELRPLKKNELRTPSAGVKITEPEFRKMLTEQTERMRANGANIIIRN